MAKIQIKGAIISNDDKWFYDWFEMDSTSPNDIVLPENNEDLEVLINSGGGDVFAGSEIYTMLKAYEGNVTMKIVGVAASAASVIAMAGDTIEISPTAQMMIHNVSTVAEGDSKIFSKLADDLETFNKSISNAYLNKTGKTQDELLELMNEETWFDAESAVENGFADKVMFKDEAPVLVANSTAVVPRQFMDNIKALRKEVAELRNQAEHPVQKVEIDAFYVDKAIKNALNNLNLTKETKSLTFGDFLF